MTLRKARDISENQHLVAFEFNVSKSLRKATDTDVLGDKTLADSPEPLLGVLVPE